MNDLEKSLYMEYGTQRIPKEKVKGILEQAAKDSLIEEKDITELPSMHVNDLLEHISFLRRQFLYQDELLNYRMGAGGNNEGLHSGVLGSSETNRDPKVLDCVLKAYFEYEKIHSSKSCRRAGILWAIAAAVILTIGISTLYTPKPY